MTPKAEKEAATRQQQGSNKAPTRHQEGTKDDYVLPCNIVLNIVLILACQATRCAYEVLCTVHVTTATTNTTL